MATSFVSAQRWKSVSCVQSVELHFTEVVYELEMVQHGTIIKNLDSMICEKRLRMFTLRKKKVKVKSKHKVQIL